MKFRHRVALGPGVADLLGRSAGSWIFDAGAMVDRKKKALIIAAWWFGRCLFFHSVGKFISPTDEVIFFRGVGQPPTRLDVCRWKRPVGLVAVRCCTVVGNQPVTWRHETLRSSWLRSPIWGGSRPCLKPPVDDEIC